MWICASAECLIGEHSRAALCVCCSQMLWKNTPNLAACFLQGIQYQERLKSIDKAGMGQATYAVMMAVYGRHARDVKGAFSGHACRWLQMLYKLWNTPSILWVEIDHIIDLRPIVQIITICALLAASLAITPQGDQKASRKNMDKNGTAKDCPEDRDLAIGAKSCSRCRGDVCLAFRSYVRPNVSWGQKTGRISLH